MRSDADILELLNGQPKMLDAVTANEVMRTLNTTVERQTVARRPLTVADGPVEVKPRHRVKVKGRKGFLGFGRSVAEDEERATALSRRWRLRLPVARCRRYGRT